MNRDEMVTAAAEAIKDAHNEVVFGESNDEAWSRLAAAAVDAVLESLSPPF